jgi:hypothetical protein
MKLFASISSLKWKQQYLISSEFLQKGQLLVNKHFPRNGWVIKAKFITTFPRSAFPQGSAFFYCKNMWDFRAGRRETFIPNTEDSSYRRLQVPPCSTLHTVVLSQSVFPRCLSPSLPSSPLRVPLCSSLRTFALCFCKAGPCGAGLILALLLFLPRMFPGEQTHSHSCFSSTYQSVNDDWLAEVSLLCLFSGISRGNSIKPRSASVIVDDPLH